MQRKFLDCPYCGKSLALQGLFVHVRIHHAAKYKDFRAIYPTLKKAAKRKESKPKPGPPPHRASPRAPAKSTPPIPTTDLGEHHIPSDKSGAPKGKSAPPAAPGGDAVTAALTPSFHPLVNLIDDGETFEEWIGDIL